MAQNVNDVQNALKFALKYKIPICARSGAHNNEGYSLCTGMVIDQSMRKSKFKVNIKRMLIKTEAGVFNGDIASALAEYNVALPAGTCPNVGISGLVLGGGVGFLMRKYGLTCDNLVELDIILADGSLVTVNESKHTDLFWACKGGGGGNFGIVTSFTFKVYPIKDVCIFEITYDLKYIEETLQLWQEWAPKVDDRLTSEYNIATASSLVAKDLYILSLKSYYCTNPKINHISRSMGYF